jgi:hypothetical protein
VGPVGLEPTSRGGLVGLVEDTRSAGVQTIVDRVGGSEVTEAGDPDGRKSAGRRGQGAGVFVTRAPCSVRWVREAGAPAPPAARPRAEGALEPVKKAVTSSAPTFGAVLPPGL